MVAIDLRAHLKEVTCEDRGNNLEGNETVVSQFVRHIAQSRGRSAATVGAYESLLGMWVDTVSPRHILRVTVADMDLFVNRWKHGQHGQPRAAASRKRDANMLRTFYKWAWEQDLTSEWLAKALHGPTVPPRNPRPIPDELWLRMWQAPLPTSDRVTLGLGYFLGLRVSELASLRPDQVTPTSIVNFVRKGGGEDTLDWPSVVEVLRLSTRTRHLVTGELTSEIVKLKQQRDDPQYLLPYLGRGKNVSNRFTAITRHLGLGHLTAHQMRHSAATNLIRAGLPLPLVKEVMNHSNINITMGYVAAGGEHLRAWLGDQT
jgi:integrase/recombinase XerD